MSLYEFAKSELELLDWTDDKEIYNGMLSKSVLELIKLFAKQEHSGASVSVVREVFYKLSKFKPLTELTNNQKEWMEISDNLYQSRRNPNCFSTDLEYYYDLDGKIVPKWKRKFIKNVNGMKLIKLK